jgi:CHAD domain-containing protein
MAFGLRPKENIAKGITRSIQSQIKRSLSDLDDLNAEGSVHELRKRFKRIRALLRLVRSQIGDKAFRKLDACVRESGRKVADFRDADVLLSTLDGLRDANGIRVRSDTAERLHEQLVARRNAALAHVLGDEQTVDDIKKTLKAVRRDVERWKIGSGWESIARGMMGTYAAAQECVADALVDPSIENLHAWRKEAKSVWYQLQFLCALRPRVITPLEQRLHALGDLLGDDHDLAVLTQTIAEHAGGWKIADDALPLAAAVRKKRIELQERAFVSGRNLFKQSPQRFATHLHGRQRVAHRNGRQKA